MQGSTRLDEEMTGEGDLRVRVFSHGRRHHRECCRAHSGAGCRCAHRAARVAVPDRSEVDQAAIRTRRSPTTSSCSRFPAASRNSRLARINDPFNPPDWRPNDHLTMPDVVAQGPQACGLACAYCHTPTGQGRPENSALAGLPEAYFKEQLQDWTQWQTQAHRVPTPTCRARTWLKIAKAMTDAEIDASAKYFAQQKLRRRVYVHRKPAHPARRARRVDLRGSRRHRRSRRPPARSHQ